MENECALQAVKAQHSRSLDDSLIVEEVNVFAIKGVAVRRVLTTTVTER